ncbi:hypothetical protein DPV78_006891 [Talaromyces pinophilus]|nr:hypothetical protein DPV78_006891 [Talaromyces pinophilus]
MTSLFSRLPLEVMIMILQYAPDLASIYKIICVSASANAAFQIDSTCILENAIERSIPEYKHLARMIAILGSYLASSPHPTFEELVDTYHNLPEDVLTTAPASSVFRSSLGSRYLILTAYRIETLQHVCFVYLLQNIHEVVWSVESTDESHLYPLKHSKDNVSFEAAAWWSPSWVEKTRITRALWKLMIYWNIQAISPIVMDDYGFSRYRGKIQHLSPCIGPDLPNHNRENSFHEIEEFKCVLAATRDLLDYPYEPFTPFTGHHTFHKFQVKEWISSTIFKETLKWKSEEPNPTTGRDARKHEHDSSVNEMNSFYRDFLWRHWFQEWYGCTTPKPGGCSPQYLDYLGLCIWDSRRQGFFGLAIMYEKYPGPYSGPLRNPKYFSSSPSIPTRWSGLLMREVTRLPGGQSRQLGKGLKMLAQIGIQEQKDIPTS